MSLARQFVGRVATIDELLCRDCEAGSSHKTDADLAAKRLAAWCRAATGGDWLAFDRRLTRDELAFPAVLARFTSVPSETTAFHRLVEDATWIEAALLSSESSSHVSVRSVDRSFPFEQLMHPLVDQAQTALWASIGDDASSYLAPAASACLRDLLREALCSLCAPALYERFVSERVRPEFDPSEGGRTSIHDRFVRDMQAHGLRRLFGEKPVLLRLISVLVRQWLETTQEFIKRLRADLPSIRRLVGSEDTGRAAHIEGLRSDPHHGGRSILIVSFENQTRVVYKPKNLCPDVAWYGLIRRLNGAEPPVALYAARAIACDGYGWTEHISHAGLQDGETAAHYFRRAGAWLALFHCFAATDMHHENIVAAGDHPVPIDLETLLQAADERQDAEEADARAVAAAKRIIANSVMATGLLPAYGRTSDMDIFVGGGMASGWRTGAKLTWRDIGSDTMRPHLDDPSREVASNLPHIDGIYANYSDHVEDFVGGFKEYARFLSAFDGGSGRLYEGFAGLQMRRVIRPTQFYYMLLQRLKDDRSMADGAIWSAQADFLSRLADWNTADDPQWCLQASERAALLQLDVPMFLMASDGKDIFDHKGPLVQTQMTSGLDRARARTAALDEQEIGIQADIIRQNSDFAWRSGETSSKPPDFDIVCGPDERETRSDVFLKEADLVADELAAYAIERGASAAWIGRGWLRDSDVSQLTVLGPNLYNGACGIALFLAAHARTRGRRSSADLALAAVANLRHDLRGHNAPRLARSLGLGGATGLGSIVYAFATISSLLGDDSLLTDARRAADLISEDLMSADRQLDVVNGSAGAILGLLRLHRAAQADDVLQRAIRCGEHLLAQPRVGDEGRRSWRVAGPYAHALNGMSHGAAGFAYALASLAVVSGRDDFATAAAECVAFENASYDDARGNWPDHREAEVHWRSQWCHGAVGIGLGRLTMLKIGASASLDLAGDIEAARLGAERAWPGHVDTLCCGSLGNIELLLESGKVLERPELHDLAGDRLSTVLRNAEARGDYRWNGGQRRFNLGLFRGLAGVGYTCLRQCGVLPNILIWD